MHRLSLPLTKERPDSISLQLLPPCTIHTPGHSERVYTSFRQCSLRSVLPCLPTEPKSRVHARAELVAMSSSPPAPTPPHSKSKRDYLIEEVSLSHNFKMTQCTRHPQVTATIKRVEISQTVMFVVLQIQCKSVQINRDWVFFLCVMTCVSCVSHSSFDSFSLCILPPV